MVLGQQIPLFRARLLRLDDKTLGHLRGVAGEGALAILGPREWLPWSPGCTYLGAAPEAPGLYLPTVTKPAVPSALLLATLQSRFPTLALPLACLPTTLLSLADAAPLTRAALRAL